jgi:CheY-like chemotaxis protein
MAARILLIEDHPDNRTLIVYLLEFFGHQVETAENGEEGVEKALKEIFDLIICDIHLPGIDGYEVANRLKSNSLWRPVPLIAVTALAMVGDRDKVLKSGFEGHLSKPITPHLFTRQIESFLPATQSRQT